ncbi:MAG: hypothetical protein GY777_02385 [Candidatus Brocadiaceae bacterium]|nr:hypothetical protein [Candidatus Brocadiaceae bacterium]
MAGVVLVSSASQADIYTDDLSRCLVESSSSDDKITLVRWMFSAMALHPAVKTIAPVNESERASTNKEMADLMVDLISVRCLEPSKNAVKYEGAIALQASFEVFGKVAAQELFSNPNVAQGLSELNSYVDIEKLNQAIGIPK